MSTARSLVRSWAGWSPRRVAYRGEGKAKQVAGRFERLSPRSLDSYRGFGAAPASKRIAASCAGSLAPIWGLEADYRRL